MSNKCTAVIHRSRKRSNINGLQKGVCRVITIMLKLVRCTTLQPVDSGRSTIKTDPSPSPGARLYVGDPAQNFSGIHWRT